MPIQFYRGTLSLFGLATLVSFFLQPAVEGFAKRVEFRVPAAACNLDVEILQALVGFHLGGVQIHHLKIVIGKAVGGEQFLHCRIDGRNSRQLRLDPLASGLLVRSIAEPHLMAILPFLHYSVSIPRSLYGLVSFFA